MMAFYPDNSEFLQSVFISNVYVLAAIQYVSYWVPIYFFINRYSHNGTNSFLVLLILPAIPLLKFIGFILYYRLLASYNDTLNYLLHTPEGRFVPMILNWMIAPVGFLLFAILYFLLIKSFKFKSLLSECRSFIFYLIFIVPMTSIAFYV